MTPPNSPSLDRASAGIAGPFFQADATGAGSVEAPSPRANRGTQRPAPAGEPHQPPKRQHLAEQPQHAGQASTPSRRASLPLLALDGIECVDISGAASAKQTLDLSHEPTTPELEKKVKQARPKDTAVCQKKLFFSIETEADKYLTDKGDLPEQDKSRKTTLLLRKECTAAFDSLGYGIDMLMAVREKICNIKVNRNASEAAVATNVRRIVGCTSRFSSIVNDVLQIYIEAIRPKDSLVITHKKIVSQVRRQTAFGVFEKMHAEKMVSSSKLSPLRSYIAQVSKSNYTCNLLFDSIEETAKAELVFLGKFAQEPEGEKTDLVSSFLRRRYDAAQYFLKDEDEISALLWMREGIKYIPIVKRRLALNSELTGQFIFDNKPVVDLINPLVCQFAETELHLKNFDRKLFKKNLCIANAEITKLVMNGRKKIKDMGFEDQLASDVIGFLGKLCFLSKYNSPVFEVMITIMGLAPKETFDEFVAQNSNPQKMVEVICGLERMDFVRSNPFAQQVLFEVKKALYWPNHPAIRYLRNHAADQQKQLGTSHVASLGSSSGPRSSQPEDQPLVPSSDLAAAVSGFAGVDEHTEIEAEGRHPTALFLPGVPSLPDEPAAMPENGNWGEMDLELHLDDFREALI
jgi:hypothetical protein